MHRRTRRCWSCYPELLISGNSGLRAGLLGLALVVASGCDGPRPSTQDGSRSPRRTQRGVFDGITLTPLEVEFSGPPARTYGGAVRHALSPTEQSVAAVLAERGMQADPALHRAARELARTLPNGANVPSRLIEAVLAWAGVVDPPPRLVVVELPEDPAACYRKYTAACGGAVYLR